MPAGRQEALGVEVVELGLGILGRMGTQELEQSSYQDQPGSFLAYCCL